MLLLSSNVQDLLAESQTLYERRFNSPFDGPIIPVKQKYNSIHCRRYMRPSWNFHGYALNARRSWTGDLFMVDTEDLNSQEK